MFDRYGIDAFIHELNGNWIAGLKTYPGSKPWKLYGAQLAEVFDVFFTGLKTTVH